MKHYLEEELEKLVRIDSKVFKFIQNYSLDGMWYWDLVNPEAEFIDNRFWEILGYDPKDKAHNPNEWFDIIDPEHLKIAKENLAKHLEDENHPYDQVVRYTHKTGKDIWVRCRGFVIRNEKGKPVRLLGCHNDITELKKSEARSIELLKSYRALVDTNSIFYLKTDAQGNYTYANDCFLNRFGYKLHEIIGTNSMNSIIPEDHEKCYKIVSKCFEEPNVPHPIVLRKPYKDGIIRSNHWEFYGVTNEDTNIIEIICVGVEITDLVDRTVEIQKMLEVEADKNHRLQQHSYITSHNIRNSVSNLLGIFEVIEDDPDGIEGYLEMLKTSVLALDETLKNLTKLLTEEKEADYAQLELVNVKKYLKRIINLETAEIAHLKAEINLNCKEDISIKTLPSFFDSVFHNLISNALKYGINEKNHTIDINVGYEDKKIFIEVRDYGNGFDLPNNAELLFRLGSRLDREKIGQGLGLFITKHHAKKIGADIIVTAAKNKGASFKVLWNE